MVPSPRTKSQALQRVYITVEHYYERSTASAADMEKTKTEDISYVCLGHNQLRSVFSVVSCLKQEHQHHEHITAKRFIQRIRHAAGPLVPWLLTGQAKSSGWGRIRVT